MKTMLNDIRLQYYPRAVKGAYYYIGNSEYFRSVVYENGVILSWGSIISPDDYPLVRALLLVPDKTQIKDAVFPGYVRELPNLKFLGLPLPFISKLKQGDIPESVEALRITNAEGFLDVGNEAASNWPQDIILPNVKMIKFQNNFDCSELHSLVGISQKCFPNLEFLGCGIDKKPGNILHDIKQFSSLKFLETEFAYSHPLFDNIKSPLTGLDIEGARKGFPIHQIINLNNLKYIRLNGIEAIIDCQLFTQLPDLVELDVLNSNKIINAEALLDCAKLQQIRFRNCKNPFKEIKEKFYAMNYQNISIEYA